MTITSVNAVYTLAIASLFPAPQVLQQYSADDMFATDSLASAQAVMGLDGFLTGGFNYVPVMQTINLQGDSPSLLLFDNWWAASQVQADIYVASGIIVLPSVQKKYTLTRGILTTYAPISNAAKVLQPRRMGITWQSVVSNPTL